MMLTCRINNNIFAQKKRAYKAMSMLNNPEDIIEQKYSEVGLLSLRKDDIITFEPREGKTEHTVEAMQVEVEIYLEWIKGNKLRFLGDNRSLRKLDSDVRVFAQQNLHKFSYKTALLVESGISSVLINFFIHLNRPQIPIKTFTCSEKAMEWLKEG